jgi:hypothetical protein
MSQLDIFENYINKLQSAAKNDPIYNNLDYTFGINISTTSIGGKSVTKCLSIEIKSIAIRLLFDGDTLNNFYFIGSGLNDFTVELISSNEFPKIKRLLNKFFGVIEDLNNLSIESITAGLFNYYD